MIPAIKKYNSVQIRCVEYNIKEAIWKEMKIAKVSYGELIYC